MALGDSHKNFAYSTVATAPSPAASGTSLVVAAGEGAKFPTPPFNATIWPSDASPLTTNAEIVRVTAISTDTLTITRAQESTAARTVIVGDQIAATITAKTLEDIETHFTASGSNVYTLPSATDTLVGRASTDTLTNKTITDSTNTVYDSRMKIARLTSDYTNATTTGTEITGLQLGSTGTGTFYFEWYLLVQSSATTTGWKIGVNHTGTATLLSANMTYPSTGGTAATGVGEDNVANNTGAIYEAAAATTFTTTAPNLGPTAGVASTGASILVKVFGIIAVTVSGDLEIWCGAETTGTITVKENSVGHTIKYA